MIIPLSFAVSFAVLVDTVSISERARVSELLGREIPQAFSAGKFEQLSVYFDDSVKMNVNIPLGTTFNGKKGVFSALTANPFRRSGISPQTSSVVVSYDRVIVLQNIPQKIEFDKLDLAPRVDTFHINADGKVYLIETFIGSKARSTEGKKSSG